MRCPRSEASPSLLLTILCRYQKRRTLLLSQFLGNSPVAAELKGLRVHSPDNTAHPLNDGSRNASLAALNSNANASVHQYGPRPDIPPQSPARSSSGRLDTMASDYGGFANNRSQEGQRFAQGGRPEQLRLGVHNPVQRQPSYGQETFIPRAPQFGGDSPEPTMTMASTVSGANYAFNPAHQVGYNEEHGGVYDQSHAGTMMDSHGTMLGESQQGYFSDFAGQQAYDGAPNNYGGGPHRYSSSDAFSPTAAMAPPMLTTSDLPPPAALDYQMPLEPREVPFAVYDPHDKNTPMSKFDNIAAVLRHRSRTTGKAPAYWVLDGRGKEIASITWDKLSSRAEKVAQVIRDKSSLYRGDRVALIYRDVEIIDFAIALLGCFIAGVVAVPINDLEDYPKLNVILTSTQAHLALTTDYNLKAFQRDITTQKLNWPRGVEWWENERIWKFSSQKEGRSTSSHCTRPGLY